MLEENRLQKIGEEEKEKEKLEEDTLLKIQEEKKKKKCEKNAAY
jgi:hypothetical protein